MKRAAILFLLVGDAVGGAVGCAPKPPLPAVVVSSQSPRPLSIFDSSPTFPEARLEESAAVALKNGLYLEASAASQCWQEENRQTVREICLLLWASGGADHPVLEDALEKAAVNSRLAAIAAVKRKAFLSRLGFPALLSVLDRLSGDPLWLRAGAVLGWLDGRTASFQEQEQLLAVLLPGEESGPKDWQLALSARRALRPSSWLSALSSHCDPATRGEARLRCWRVVGALAGTPGLEEVRAFLPSEKGDDWTLFLRAFPAIALQLENQERSYR
jgi:hypothetical protein